MAIADFHLHSTASDGTSPPTDLVALVARQGVRTMALTDHDTTAGVEEAIAAGEQFRVRVIPGIEISTDLDGGGEAHLLGYFASTDHAALQSQLKRYREGRQTRGLQMMRNLERLGVPVEWERVLAIAGEAAVGRPHVAQAMVEAGYVTSVGEAFEAYLRTGGPADARREKLPPAEAVQLIRANDGVAVLAHPQYLPDADATVELLHDAGLQGIEVYYKSHGADAVARFGALARRYDLVAAGGSDYHGTKDDEHLPGELPLPAAAGRAFVEFLEHAWGRASAQVGTGPEEEPQVTERGAR